MKKTFAILIAFACILASCVKNGSKYECDYFAEIDSISYDLHEDSVAYDSLLRISLRELGIVQTIFRESAQDESGFIQDARTKCNIQAENTFSQRCKSLELNQVKRVIYNHNPALAPSAEEIRMAPFSVYMSLYSADSRIPLGQLRKNF